MIESRWVKALVVVTFFSLALVFSVGGSPRRRHIGYPVAIACALIAVFVLLRVKVPEPKPMPAPGSPVGDVDLFIASVPHLAEQFHAWASGLGLQAGARPDDLREWIWEHRDDIGGDWGKLFRPAVAAYGESLRKSDPRTIWSKRGYDVLVESPGRPWTRMRVATEIHDTIYADI